MVVTSSVDVDLPASKESLQVFQHFTAGLALDNVKRKSDLPLQRHLVIAVDGAAEAAFSIHETHHPSWVDEPFLLIFRRNSCELPTDRIVTAVHVTNLFTGCDKNS